MSNNIITKKINKRNWKEINYGKTKKFWVLLDKSTVSKEQEKLLALNFNKEGAKYKYSNELIEFIYMIGLFFRLDYRKLQTFCILFASNFNIFVPDYTTINRRFNKLSVEQKYISKRKQQQYCIAVDGRGINPTNRGEWLRLIHKKGLIKTRNGFIKILISVDVNTQEICGVEVFDDSEGETKYLLSVLLQAIQNKNQPIDVLYGDGAYDKYDIFEMLQEARIEPIINIHKNADLKLNQEDSIIRRRRKMEEKLPKRTLVAREQLKDKPGWKKKWGYGKRWVVETVFSAFKRTMGQAVNAKHKMNIKNEMIAKVNLYNLMKNC